MTTASLLTALLLAVSLFAATNVDDIFVLVGFFADPKFRAREVVVGQYLGIGTLVLVSIVAAFIALFVPPVYVGLLGLVPIAMGCKKLFDLWQRKDAGDEDAEHRSAGSGPGRALSVAKEKGWDLA